MRDESSLVGVLTTIQPPTACVHRLAEVLGRAGSRLIVIGDRKGPADYPLPGADFFSLAEHAAALRLRLCCRSATTPAKTSATCWPPTAARLPVRDRRRQRTRRRLAAAPPQRLAPSPSSTRPWMNVYRAFAADEQLIWAWRLPLWEACPPIPPPATH